MGFGAATSATLDSAPLGLRAPQRRELGSSPVTVAINPNDDVEVMLSSGAHVEVSLQDDSLPPVAPARSSQQHGPTPPPATPSRRPPDIGNQSKFGFFVGGAGLVLIIAAFIVLALKQPSVQTTVQALPPANSNDTPRTFTLMIDSYPQGADVIDRGACSARRPSRSPW